MRHTSGRKRSRSPRQRQSEPSIKHSRRYSHQEQSDYTTETKHAQKRKHSKERNPFPSYFSSPEQIAQMNRKELIEELERQESMTTPVKRWSIPIPEDKMEQTPMPTPIKDWTPRPSPERQEDYEEKPQISYVSFPTRRVISRKDFFEDSRTKVSTQDTNALHNSPTTEQPKCFFLTRRNI